MTHLESAQVWHVLTRDHTVLPAIHTFIRKWNEPHVPLFPSRRASPHFGWYSFPVPLRTGGCTNWAWRRVTSLIRPTTLPLCHAATHAAMKRNINCKTAQSVQLEGTPYHSPSYIWVRAIVWECGEGQTHRCAWQIYILHHLRLTWNVIAGSIHYFVALFDNSEVKSVKW